MFDTNQRNPVEPIRGTTVYEDERVMLTKKLIIAMMFILMLAAGGVQAGGDTARGAELAVDCADCHGDDGLGDEDFPPLAGLEKEYLVAQMMAFQSGERVDEDEMMADYVADLSEQDMAGIAAYFVSFQQSEAGKTIRNHKT